MSEHSDVIGGGTFFTKISVSNADGTLGVGCEALTARLDILTAIDDAVSDAEENGGEHYVYECRAVRKVTRGKTRIVTIKK